ncbi:DUF1479-domain-containing protein [Laetiporus sulphureus 93-53]|uniref:DUF1479-domain-containing protein n=1 Tax=Laetiporus sulphureus 93-53 TaxID=1314785 RepID=A0A165DR24_9APHY|nr:DUF1479-domain-containing protein [Laetiporus sulphureus 93-53]KZT05445.1 DUF1479-domain-containing protein [Laetiporus sulphureus 93-53]
MLRIPKKEGTVKDISDKPMDEPEELPPRFAALKRDICTNPAAMEKTWRSVLKELEGAVAEIEQKGADVIPQVAYSDIVRGLSDEQIKDIKHRGVVIVKGGVPCDEALVWKESITDYIARNKEHVTGTPPEKIVFYELYNSLAQVRARTHPALLGTQKALLSLWHASPPPIPSLAHTVSLRTPISYFDRLRMRPPGPSVFTLGPHIDGGGIERWEDPGFRACFRAILADADGEGWRTHDPFDASPRLGARQDLYNAANQCTVFRPWQGWTALSTASQNEGTLRVLPLLSLATAYIMLRPFFRPATSSADEWELDLTSSAFPGSRPGRTQYLSGVTHPHLKLAKTIVSIPKVEPGDQVYWHCDLVHAVENEHNGREDSSVIYIPATPLTEYNARYLRTQRETFLAGLPAPDFPIGEGESRFVGRAGTGDVRSMGLDARRVLGFAPFEVPTDADASETALIERANEILAADADAAK